jgi:acyl-coenzyme A thioesterase PaaI-like protein
MEAEAAYEELIGATRLLLARLREARPATDVSHKLAKVLNEVSDSLAEYAADEATRFGGRLAVAGRGQTLVPPLHYDDDNPDRVTGHVEFSTFYIGSGAVHGGAPPLVFDEIFGVLAAQGGRPRSRTAFLHVNYRKITPLDRELRFEARVDRIEGRKIFMVGTLSDGDDVFVDAECLYVFLRDDQP